MNDTIKQLYDRKSVRQYADRAIDDDTKRQIIEAALQAPSAGNQLLYSILDITDQALKDSLAISCDNQPFIASAPMVLIFLADCRRWLDAYEFAGANPRQPGPGDLLLACADACIAAQNSVVAAHSLGIGSCYIGDILENREQHMELLGLDEYTLPACMLVYGYPTEQQQRRQKPTRFEAGYILHENRYSRPTEAEARAAFAQQSGKDGYDFDEDLRKFCARKYESPFAREMNRSAAGYLNIFYGDERKESE